jgi:hypothetical protein
MTDVNEGVSRKKILRNLQYNSSNLFRSSDLGVTKESSIVAIMGPARYHCAMLLY